MESGAGEAAGDEMLDAGAGEATGGKREVVGIQIAMGSPLREIRDPMSRVLIPLHCTKEVLLVECISARVRTQDKVIPWTFFPDS